ncbi:MerR family transcriptional regulator [Actinoplanes sp. NPDC024001]|uniref:MerR family transcriptional regulator n=1 Tax=Actinoplanes sp. NPDC024001 TaxID=3154598 RepID=UPI0033D82389
MRIGALSRETGVSIRLLRYYEEQGLLTAERSGTGHRRYDSGAPLVVRQIRALLAAGLPTATIREVLPCVTGAGPDVDECVAGLLRERLSDLDQQIATLSEARTALAGLIPA